MASVQSARGIIAAADLSPTEHLLLKHFVDGAVDPEHAAEYLITRVKASNGHVEDAVREFKQQWRGLAFLCIDSWNATLG